MLLRRERNPRGPPIMPSSTIGGYRVTLRPYLKEFLQFCLCRFRVGIWSSMSSHNLRPLTTLICHHTRIHISNFAFIYDQSHCTVTRGVFHPDKPGVPLYAKSFVRFGPQFDVNNTTLVDDSLEKGWENPHGSCICVEPFVGDPDDDYLSTNLISYLCEMCTSELTSLDFILNKPFN